jgi:hypothetical protein
MPSTYTLISSNVLASSAASVTFSSIPSTYTDLVLRVSARPDSSGDAYLTFNGVAGTSYSSTDLQGTGSVAQSSRQSNTSRVRLQNFASTTTANTFASAEIYIPSYAATINKPVSAISADEANATAAFITATAGLFSNTSAITSVTLTYSSLFVSGSSFYLYGIKKS